MLLAPGFDCCFALQQGVYSVLIRHTVPNSLRTCTNSSSPATLNPAPAAATRRPRSRSLREARAHTRRRCMHTHTQHMRTHTHTHSKVIFGQAAPPKDKKRTSFLHTHMHTVLLYTIHIRIAVAQLNQTDLVYLQRYCGTQLFLLIARFGIICK